MAAGEGGVVDETHDVVVSGREALLDLLADGSIGYTLKVM